jgi:hypothetical protein
LPLARACSGLTRARACACSGLCLPRTGLDARSGLPLAQALQGKIGPSRNSGSFQLLESHWSLAENSQGSLGPQEIRGPFNFLSLPKNFKGSFGPQEIRGPFNLLSLLKNFKRSLALKKFGVPSIP